jgi:serine/threonine-protein kinase RsbW
VNLTRVAQFLARWTSCGRCRPFWRDSAPIPGCRAQACLRLNLVVEELFTNTVKHGHHGDCDAPIWVEVSRAGDRVELIYEDKAPPFNPYSKLLDQPPPDTTVSMRKIGGLGVLLTRQLAASRDYAYLFGRNRIRLVLAPS